MGLFEIGVVAAAVIVLLLVILFTCYVKAPPSTAYVISGIKREPRILIGAGGVKIPIFERLDKVYLGQLTVDIRTERSVPTNDFINVNVDAVAKVAVTPTPEGVRLAARNFLNMDANTISGQLQDTLQGNLRELIGSQGLKELNVDRDGFSNQVMDKAAPDMAKLGISILAFNVQNITDELGLIENLGADNTWTIRKNAAITKAQAEKDIAQAKAENEKLANDATVASQTAIAERQNEL
ncbi:MAG: flotillin family protein, partial [Muribaculaceae bacterium]|nr:flotillin family protein [Muribaculaceae bacterium]